MNRKFNPANAQQLRLELLDAYTRQRVDGLESDAVRQLKQELYRRGADREDIVTIALAALLRQNLN